MNAHYRHLNTRNVPVKQEGESDADFKARLDWFRKHDNRVPVAGWGMPNFGFGVSYGFGGGVLCNTMKTALEKSEMDGENYGPSDDYVYAPRTYGSWSLGDN